jgi:5-methylcytosine-specific restriction endonuclease McrA
MNPLIVGIAIGIIPFGTLASLSAFVTSLEYGLTMIDVLSLIVSILVVVSPLTLYYLYHKNKEGDKSKRERRKTYNLRRGVVRRRLNSKIYTFEERKQILSFTDDRCFYCMAFLSSTYWEIDHLWPKRLGGVDDFFNLVASCEKCNKSKWTRNPFYHLVQRWNEQGYLNEYQIKFLRYYSCNSPSRLTTHIHWVSFMEDAPKNIAEFLDAIENNPAPSTKEKQKIYNQYSRLFFDYPPPKTRWG